MEARHRSLLIKAIVIVFLLAAIAGGAGIFIYELYMKPARLAREDHASGAAALPPDPSLPEFGKCEQVESAGNLVETRTAWEAFIDNHPYSTKLKEARKRLGEINSQIVLSRTPSPDKEEYLVKSGDVITRVAAKMKSTPELIMRSNGREGTMLRIGEKLMITPLDLSIVINRKEEEVTLLNHGRFFKEYSWRSAKIPQSKKPGPFPGKVSDKMAWHEGQRINFEDKSYAGSARWISFTVSGYTLYSEPSDAEAAGKVNKPPAGIGMAPEDMEELSTLISKGNPVTIE